MSKHTPAPWNATPYSSVVGIAITALPRGLCGQQVIAGIHGHKEEAEANARLIAAAPDLAAALYALFDATVLEQKHWDAARAALVKAGL